MNPRLLCLLLTGVLVTACLAGCARRPAGSGPVRHVVLISLDTARADHFGFLGNREVRTPRLDALADESVVFTDCMTAAPTTLASHTTIFTGKYPHHHGTARNGFIVNDLNAMLAEILQREGFHTAGFAASFALSDRFNFAQGFDHYDEEFSILLGDRGARQNQRSGADVTDAVIGYLDENGVPDNLFLFVHYFDPHQPYLAPPPYDTMYDPLGTTDLPKMWGLTDLSHLTDSEKESYARRFELQYASQITYMDHHVGRLIDDLGHRGVLDESILVVTSDHGENMRDHDVVFDHGFTVYQSTMHALLVIRMPGGESGGTRVDDLVSTVDILPTLLGYLGVAPPSGIDGEALELRGDAGRSTSGPRFGQATKPRTKESDPRWANMLKARCVREGRFKFLQTPYQQTEELYDLLADPGETVNLLEGASPDVAAVADGLRRKLEVWAATADPLASHFDEKRREETRKRLRSLGYIK